MVIIDKAICIGCSACVKDCIAHNIILEEGKAKIKRECIQCGHCTAVCPVDAVSIDDYDMKEVEEYNEDTFRLSAEHLLHAIKFRRSVRDYQSKKVEPEKLKAVLQAGRYTATAKNMQDCSFVFVQEELEELRERVWSGLDSFLEKGVKEIPKEWFPFVAFNRRRKENAADDYLFRNAPVVVFVTSDYPLDAGLAAQNMEMMAVAEGLGMLFNGFLARAVNADETVKKWLGIEGQEIRACMLMGYPSISYRRTAPRREANVIWK